MGSTPNTNVDPTLGILLNGYLQRRRFSGSSTGGASNGTNHLGVLQRSQSLKALGLNQLLSLETSTNHAIVLSAIDSNAGLWEQQYAKFKVTFPNALFT